MIITTREFDIWWRDFGQFLPPADKASAEQLEYLKEFASAMHGKLSESFNSKVSQIEQEYEDLVSDDIGDFKEEVRAAMRDALDEKAALEAARKMVAA